MCNSHDFSAFSWHCRGNHCIDSEKQDSPSLCNKCKLNWTICAQQTIIVLGHVFCRVKHLLNWVLLLYHPLVYKHAVFLRNVWIHSAYQLRTFWSLILNWNNLHTYFHFQGQWASRSLCLCVCSRVCSNVKVSQDPIDSALFLFAWWLWWGLASKSLLLLCSLCFVRTCKQLCVCACVCTIIYVCLTNLNKCEIPSQRLDNCY